MTSYVLAIVFFMNGEYLTFKTDTMQECLNMREELFRKANVYCKEVKSIDLSVKEMLELDKELPRSF